MEYANYIVQACGLKIYLKIHAIQDALMELNTIYFYFNHLFEIKNMDLTLQRNDNIDCGESLVREPYILIVRVPCYTWHHR